jgi:2'-5' RNA ligase
MRMFVAVTPPPDAVEDLDEFLSPRRDTWPGRWTTPEQWHLTLAFMAAVPDRALDDLLERLAAVAERRTPFAVSLSGAGAFPDPSRAKVLYAAVRTVDAEGTSQLERLATGARSAAVAAGSQVEGGRFQPHVTLARTGHPVEATRWLRVLDSYSGPAWPVSEIVLVDSHLGEGPRRRPRHEVVATFALGGETAKRRGNRPMTG